VEEISMEEGTMDEYEGFWVDGKGSGIETRFGSEFGDGSGNGFGSGSGSGFGSGYEYVYGYGDGCWDEFGLGNGDGGSEDVSEYRYRGLKNG
jgi:hypothetical protein